MAHAQLVAMHAAAGLSPPPPNAIMAPAAATKTLDSEAAFGPIGGRSEQGGPGVAQMMEEAESSQDMSQEFGQLTSDEELSNEE